MTMKMNDDEHAVYRAAIFSAFVIGVGVGLFSMWAGLQP